MTDKELRQLAHDIVEGHVFTDRHVKDDQDMVHVFMILGLMSPEQAQEFADSKPWLVYEYLDKAMPRSINGLPCFMSMNHLHQEETEKCFGYMKEFKEAKAKMLEGDEHG